MFSVHSVDPKLTVHLCTHSRFNLTFWYLYFCSSANKELKMAEDSETSLRDAAQLMNVLADPARLRILNLLRAKSELCSCEIGPITGYIPSKISRHLSILKQAGLLHERRDGTFIHYRLVHTSDPVIERLLGIVDILARTEPCLQQDRALPYSEAVPNMLPLSIL
ncbi:MAG: ArsR/SmtB family transcription factor [Verrucomicrobiia bacterium]